MTSADRSAARAKGRVNWFSAPAMRLHGAWILGVAGCAAASWLEWTRALSHHHEIAWVYAFEWPLFALMGSYLWWKLLHADSTEPGPAPRDTRPSNAEDDVGLRAWEDYLARLHEVDPPGAPPAP